MVTDDGEGGGKFRLRVGDHAAAEMGGIDEEEDDEGRGDPFPTEEVGTRSANEDCRESECANIECSAECPDDGCCDGGMLLRGLNTIEEGIMES